MITTQAIRRIEHDYRKRFFVPGLVKDPYVTGIIAGKLGVDGFLLATRSCLGVDAGGDDWQPGERRETFLQGVADAADYPLVDVAWAIKQMRGRNPSMFDAVVAGSLGRSAWLEIVGACEDAVEPRYMSRAEYGRLLQGLQAA